MKQINAKKIEKLRKIYADLDDLKRKTTDAIIAAKEFKHNVLLIKRKDGKEVEVKEGDLWDEIRVLRRETEAWDVMKRRYPSAFAYGEEEEKKVEELSVFCHKELGIDPMALRLLDIVQLVDAMVEYKLDSKKNG